MSNVPALTRAGLGRCLASLCYELLLLAALLLTVSAVFTGLQAAFGRSWLLDLLTQLAMLAALFGYFGYSWVHRGQTVAMKAWRIRLAAPDGRDIGWRQAALRFAIGIALFVGMPAVSYLGWARAYGHQPHTLWLSLALTLLPFLARYIDDERLFLLDRLSGTRQFLLPKAPHPRKGKKQAAQA